MKKAKGKITTILLVLVLLVGLSLLLYPKFADWWNSQVQSRAIASYTEKVQNLDTDKYKELWESARNYNKSLLGRSNEYLLSEEQQSLYHQQLNVDADLLMTLSGDFAEAGIELNGLDNEAFERVARELYEYAEENTLAPGWAPVTDENGRIKLQDLTVGVYLVVGRPAVAGDRVHYSLPQLIALPQYDEVNAEWDYAVSIVLKSISIGIDEELLDLTVEKKWIDQGFEEFRPYYITVHLLWNGKLYDSVYLSEENNWTYTWTDLLPIGEWTVEEEIPTDYVLEIPSLGLTLPVISQTSSGNLLKAPCRFFGSAYTGNLVIGAHNYATHFGRIRELSYGDRVIFTDMAGNVFVYEVADMETLRPYEGSQLCNGLWDLTLYTCTFGGEQRMTIRCEQVNAY